MGNDEQQHAMDVLSYWCAVELFSPQNWRDNQLIALSSSRNDDQRVSVSEQERLPWDGIHADLLIGPVDNERRSYTNLYNDLQSRKIYRLQTDMNARLTRPFSFAEDTENWLRAQAVRSGLDEQTITGLLGEMNQLWLEVAKQPDPLPAGTELTDSMISRLLQVAGKLSATANRPGSACAVYRKDYDRRFARRPVHQAVKPDEDSEQQEAVGRQNRWLKHERFRIAVGLSQRVVTNALLKAAKLVRELSPAEETAQDEVLQELAHRQNRRAGGPSTVASLMEFCVGDDGCLAPRSLTLSQYAKAVSCLFNHEGWPDCPAGWPHIEVFDETERKLKSEFNRLAGEDSEDGAGRPMYKAGPVGRYEIESLIEHVADRMGLDDRAVSRSPLFARADGSPLIRDYVNCHLEASSESLNGEMMDSFFLEDLEDLYQNGTEIFSEPVRQYLSVGHPRRFNLQKDPEGHLVGDLTEPANMPFGRWPSASNQFQSTGQQLAINQIRAALEGYGRSSLLGVNGPPGTGKTTLLKDVVAEIIVARARRLAGFSRPQDIFTSRRVARATSDEDKDYVYWTLDPSVTGFEIVVASSNNKAVENVSQDLPSADAIDAEWETYIDSEFKQVPCGFAFRDFAGQIADRKSQDKESSPSNTSSAWALISAVLGNMSNKNRFLWPFKNEFIYKSLRYRPDERASRTNWTKARNDFNAALEKEESIRARKIAQYKLLRSYSDLCNQRSDLSAELKTLNEQLHGMKASRSRYVGQVQSMERQMSDAGQAANNAQAAWEQADSICQVHLSYWKAHPLRSFFHSRERQQDELKVRTDLEQARRAKQHFDEQASTVHQRLQSFYGGLEVGDQKLGECQTQIATLNRQLAALEQQIAEAEQIQWPRPDIGDDHVAWMDQEWSKARTEVYIKALALHQQAVMGAARQFMCNLSLACAVMQSNGFTDDERLVAWQTFFLVIPVVSSSFASISRMFSGIGKEALGWAIVDEAGQALPQAAAGLLQRVKHAVAVGDPMQLQPVDTMPKPMRELLASTHHLQRLGLESENMQALVDYQTPCGLLDETDDHWLGMPLVVHRRCDEPMFSICNDMAYSGRMVRVGPEHQPCVYPSGPCAGDELPTSCWYDVPSNSGETGRTQWRPQEGYELHKRLCGLFKGGIDPTDILVIAPFRAVANQVRDTFADALRQCTGCNSSEASRLASSQAGTVHTSQGREADVVFIVLGSRAGRRGEGSRSWVNGSPNLLNVAVSRAKRRVYVVGNLADWKNGTYTSRIAKDLPVEASAEN
ncbi:ATP-binding domain-containing protein [Bifidobacterium sp. W8113]|uniref:AAA domain-containing protein n=1 Tax=Bifidobacterium choladohabitans TaxID=2750947 RepID=UPI0018DC2A3C|nr:AAA domain-containing protein [Bifidobacterium choladohabitans]MBI0089696.1 ATP-binding domain-containing protein [Bifidobacterium choladohabitans]